MPALPTWLEQLFLLRLNKGPGPVVDIVGALGYRALSAALNLGVFEILAERPLTAPEAAVRLGLDPRGVGLLLDGLHALGYLHRAEGADRFDLSPMARRWMLKDREDSLVPMFAYTDDMLARWARLEDTLRRGEPALPAALHYGDDPRRWQVYHGGMRAAARLVLPELLRRLHLPGEPRRLLDLGGSHALFSVAFCRRHPRLSAVVVDLPHAEPEARRTIEAEGMQDRVSFRAGDLVRDPLGEGFDAVLLFNLIRIFPPEAAATLVARAASALAPGGLLVVLDQLDPHPRSPFRRANARLINLELYNAAACHIHPPEAVRRWLGDAGLTDLCSVPLHRSPGMALMMGRRAQTRPSG